MGAHRRDMQCVLTYNQCLKQTWWCSPFSPRIIRQEIDDDELFEACGFFDERCVQWAFVDQRCFASAADTYFMATICCPVCESIQDLDYYRSCPIDHNQYNPFRKAGQVTEHFKAMLRKVADFNPIVHAAPVHLPELEYEYKKGPWIVTFDDFLEPIEMDALIRHGENMGFRRSLDGVELPDGRWEPQEVSFRTSWEQYCWPRSSCGNDPVVHELMDRLTDAVGIPLSNSDFLQLLRYV